MMIKAIASVEGARATDAGLTIVLEMLDGDGEAVNVLLPLSVLDRTITLLRQAGDQAAEVRAASARRVQPPA